MRKQPRINAVDVERVAALGKETESVFGLELAETDGAVEGVFNSDDGFVDEDGQRVDE